MKSFGAFLSNQILHMSGQDFLHSFPMLCVYYMVWFWAFPTSLISVLFFFEQSSLTEMALNTMHCVC